VKQEKAAPEIEAECLGMSGGVLLFADSVTELADTGDRGRQELRAIAAKFA